MSTVICERRRSVIFSTFFVFTPFVQVLYALATKAIEEERRGRWDQREIEESLKGRAKQGQVLQGRSKSRGRASSRSSKGSRGTSRGASTRSSSANSRASSQDGLATYRL